MFPPMQLLVAFPLESSVNGSYKILPTRWIFIRSLSNQALSRSILLDDIFDGIVLRLWLIIIKIKYIQMTITRVASSIKLTGKGNTRLSHSMKGIRAELH